MLIDANHAALEDAEEAFNRVDGHVAACVFTFRVRDRLMGRKLFAGRRIETAFIGVQSERSSLITFPATNF